METKGATLLHEWFDKVWNQRDAQTIDRLADANAIVHGLVDEQGKEVNGVEAFKKFHRQFLNTFPDLSVEVLDTVSEGEKMVARCIVRGTHQGDGLGMKATGRKIEFTGACTVRIRGGKIVEAWNDFDFLTMHTQLGTLALLSEQQS